MSDKEQQTSASDVDMSEQRQDQEQAEKAGKVAGLRRARPCPICSKPSTKGAYPFCSPRCKDVDLSRWLKGAYAIPAQEEDEPDEDDFGEIR